MQTEEIKQTSIFKYFSNTKQNTNNFRILDEKNLDEYFKTQNNKKNKRLTNLSIFPKTNNLKIKDFFLFKAYPKEINDIQKELKNMHLSSDNLTNKTLFNENLTKDNINNNQKISSFYTTLDLNNYNNSNNEKGQYLGINEYFQIQDSKTNNIYTSKKKITTENSEYKINENEKVFILDHFNCKSENITNMTEYKTKIDVNLTNFEDNFLNEKKISIEKLRNNSSFCDTKITKYINIIDPPNMKLNRELLVNVFEYIDAKNLIKKIPCVCKFWKDLYNKIISSPSYNMKIDTTDISKISEKVLNELFKRGKNLKHFKILNELITQDFGGIKGVENFLKRIALIMNLSNPKEIQFKGIMLDSFKLRPRKINEMHNLISTKSINLICENSKYSLKTLILRNCSKLNNKVIVGISSCVFLSTLEISYNDLIDDEGLIKLADKCRDIKSLNLSNLSKITVETIRIISNKMFYLECLDLSECESLIGSDLYSLRILKNLKLLLIKGIKICDNDLIFLEHLKHLNILSISNAGNLSNSALEIISNKCSSIINLDVTKNTNFTEEGLYKFINQAKNLINFKFNEDLKSNRIDYILKSRLKNVNK